MITKFKIFEKVDVELINANYFYIPYNDKKLIRATLEKYDDILKSSGSFDETMNELKDLVNYIIGLYVFVNKTRFVGYWTIPADSFPEEQQKGKEELNRFITINSMVYKGLLELEPYEINAIKYNL